MLFAVSCDFSFFSCFQLLSNSCHFFSIFKTPSPQHKNFSFSTNATNNSHQSRKHHFNNRQRIFHCIVFFPPGDFAAKESINNEIWRLLWRKILTTLIIIKVFFHIIKPWQINKLKELVYKNLFEGMIFVQKL